MKKAGMRKPNHLLKAAAIALALTATANAASAAENNPMVDGVVKEVRADGRLTIKHGPIPNLDMGSMTMIFRTNDPKLGKGLKVGDKIKFQVEDVGGKLTVMQLKKVNQ